MSSKPSAPSSPSRVEARIKMLAELTDELTRRQQLCLEYRSSFFEVISHFGPAISAIVVNRHRQRDIRLITEARNAIATHSMDRGPEAGDVSVRLSILLELHTVLCTEYRNLYFTAINLIGAEIFDIVEDYHHQHDGVVEAEAARVDNMVERIKKVVD